MKIYRVKHPFIFTIFGASGDLARLKLFPALYSLAEQKRLPSDYFIVGYARTPKNNSQFQKEFSDSIKKAQVKDLNPKILKELIKHVHYFTGQYDNLADFKKYKLFLEKLSEKKQIPHLTYFSVPPQGFKPIIQKSNSINVGKSNIITI